MNLRSSHLRTGIFTATLLVLGSAALGWAAEPKAREAATREAVSREAAADEKAADKAKPAEKKETENNAPEKDAAKDANLGTIKGKVETRPKKYGKEALVYLKEVKGQFPLPPKNPLCDQKNLVFEPHILPVLVGSTVDFRNSDAVLHNVFSPDNEKYNLGSWGKDQIKTYTFKKAGEYTQLCNVHPEMQGYIVVLQNPFWSELDKDSAFKVEKVPPGTYTLVCWCARLKSAEKEVVVKAGETISVDLSLSERK